MDKRRSAIVAQVHNSCINVNFVQFCYSINNIYKNDYKFSSTTNRTNHNGNHIVYFTNVRLTKIKRKMLDLINRVLHGALQVHFYLIKIIRVKSHLSYKNA